MIRALLRRLFGIRRVSGFGLLALSGAVTREKR